MRRATSIAVCQSRCAFGARSVSQPLGLAVRDAHLSGRLFQCQPTCIYQLDDSPALIVLLTHENISPFHGDIIAVQLPGDIFAVHTQFWLKTLTHLPGFGYRLTLLR